MIPVTIDDIRKYADEKGMPKKGIADMCKRLKADYKDGNIDEMTFHLLCAQIDRSSEFWKGVRSFLDKHREERAKKEEA